MIACELAKLLRSEANCIKNQTALSNERQLKILQTFRDVWNKNRGKVQEAVSSSEVKWRDYLTTTGQRVPKAASRDNIPEKLHALGKKDAISYENVEVISEMIDKNLNGFLYVSKTTPLYLGEAILFDIERQKLGDIDTRIQERINDLLPAKLVLSGELQHQGACLGMYALDKGRTAHGREVWRHEGGDMCIAKISGGNWAVQKEADVGVKDICVLRLRNADTAFLHLSGVAWEEALDDVWHAAAGLKCAGIEEHTPVLSTTAVSTGQAAPASGGSSTEGRGVAQQLKKSDEPTGEKSPSKRKHEDEGEGGDGDEAWYDRTTVDLMRGCLESDTNPQGFLDGLEKYEGGHICEKMLIDAGIKERVWKMRTCKEEPIVRRAVCLWDKWGKKAYDTGLYSTIAVSLLRGCLLSDDPEKFLQWFELYPDGKISKQVFIEAGIKKTLCRLELHHDRAIANRATELRRKWKTEEVERRKKIPRT